MQFLLLMQALPYSHDTAHQIGNLCASGDWAFAHSDFTALQTVTKQLATWLPEELHVYLAELEDACRDDVDRTESLWEQLKRRILECEEAWRPSDH